MAPFRYVRVFFNSTWRPFDRRGLSGRYGHFKDESPMALAERHLSMCLLTRNPQEARDKLLTPSSPEREPGTIEKGDGTVNVGGLELPVKERPTEPT